MSGQHRLDLLVPGLFGPVPLHPEDLPETPALARVLGRADKDATSGTDPVLALLDCFGIEFSPERDPPSAPYCWLAHGPQADPARGYIMHADPVHLRPDRDRVLLFDARHLALTRDESNALVALFNDHFAGDGLRLEVLAADRWYLHLECAPNIRTTALHKVVGRSIRESLPKGSDASAWARMMNEAQMLFYHAETNRIREREGRPTVSGIWPWGGGALAGRPPPSDYDAVYATDSLALGLAAASETPATPIPHHAAMLGASRGQGHALVLWDGLWRSVLDADGMAWIEGIGRLDRWLGLLVNDRKNFSGLRLRIHPCNGECYDIGAWELHRFWRGSFRLGQRVSGSAAPGS